MHSFALFALASSAFALPLLPDSVNVIGGVKALVPTKVDVAKVDVKDVNIANGAASYNDILRRDYGYNSYGGNGDGDNEDPTKVVAGLVADLKVPTDIDVAKVGLKDIKGLNGIADKNDVGSEEGNAANYAESAKAIKSRSTGSTLPTIIAAAQGNLKSVVANIQALLYSGNPSAYELNGLFNELNDIVASAIKELESLKGLKIEDILGEVESQVSLQQVAEVVADLGKTVADVLEEVQNKVGKEDPAVYVLIGGTLQTLLKTVTTLVPSIPAILRNVLYTVLQTLSYVGITIDLYAAGM